MRASEVCLAAPYVTDDGQLSALARRLLQALAPHPSLTETLAAQTPVICLSDDLYAEQGYYEPRTNRVVLKAGLNPDFQLAILIHEVRHLQQFGQDTCPTNATTLSDYIRARLALEADAAAIGIYVAWTLRQAGEAGPWDSLRTWPSHDDLVARFAEVKEAGGGDVAAVSATYAQWFARADRRGLYANAICANYLDALDRDKHLPGTLPLPDDFAQRLCVLPDGRAYDCALPP